MVRVKVRVRVRVKLARRPLAPRRELLVSD